MEKILVLDFGGQYNQLIARRVRELGVYCEILPHDADIERIRAFGANGIIFTGGPKSVYAEKAPKCDRAVFSMGTPILGICYGAQLLALELGGEVSHAPLGEYGKADISYDENTPLLTGMGDKSVCWMSHMDYVSRAPQGYTVYATTDNCPIAAFGDEDKRIFGVQFHPEVMHTVNGTRVLSNFLFNICKLSGGWSMASYAETMIARIRAQVGDKRVLLGLSGGVDSSVAAVLLHKAIGKKLVCIFVDHGLLRKNEAQEVEEVFRGAYDMNLICVDASERFLTKLAGVTDAESKRKIIGAEFVRVFEAEARKLGHVEFLAQGTIYPDVIESGKGDAAVIKSHHNVGGMPEDMDFEGIVEPLRELFKDEVRALGEELGLPHHMVWRQPFPGPGLAIRVIGDVTAEKLEILREADFVFRDEIAKAGLDEKIWQYFAVLPGNRSVGVMGDERTYDYTIGLRAVTSVDGMTADWARIPYPVLESISNRIVNEVRHVNRIVYDVTSKPPSTIEWE